MAHICSYMDHIWPCMAHIICAYVAHILTYVGHIWPYTDHIWPYMVHIWPYMDHIWPYMVHIWPWSAGGVKCCLSVCAVHSFGATCSEYEAGRYRRGGSRRELNEEETRSYGKIDHIWPYIWPYMAIYMVIYGHICPYMALIWPSLALS